MLLNNPNRPINSQKGRFLLCLSNIVDHSGDGKVKNGVIMLTLGYKIPF